MMALYRRVGKNAVLWNPRTPLRVGSADPTRYPPSIERLWSDEDLEAIGLYRAAPPDPIPEGKVEVSRSVRIVQGRPKIVIEVGDAAPPTAEGVLRKRRQLLEETDYYYLSDTPKAPAGMNKYRQALRDITEQKGFPHDVVWPERPKG